MNDWFFVSDNINLVEIIALIVTLIGLTTSIVLYLSAIADRDTILASKIDDLTLVMAESTVMREILRLIEQSLILSLTINTLFIPSMFGWRSVTNSMIVGLLSLIVTTHSIAAWRLRRRIAARQGGDDEPPYERPSAS